MRIYIIILLAFGIALLSVAIFVVAKIYPNYSTAVIKKAPIIHHDAENVFNFINGPMKYDSIISTSKELNFLEDAKNNSNLEFDAF